MISYLEVFERLLLAAVLGGVIGIEREMREWAAGLRTHMLVCLGAALAMIVSTYGFFDVLDDKGVILDPSRIAAQVISGIGFLGAGAILFLQREQVIRGLTTAAGLWVVAAIGLAAGSGMYVAAALGTAVAWLIMAGLKPLERRIFRHTPGPPRMLLGLDDTGLVTRVQEEVDACALPIHRTVLHHAERGEAELELVFSAQVRESDLARLADRLRQIPGLVSVTFGVVSSPSTAHS